jgi:hydrogenase maturation protease
MKTLVLGLGNSILSDDGVGLYIAQEIKQKINSPDVTVTWTEAGGINLLEYLIGYDKVIIIDAVLTGKGAPGTITRYDGNTINACRHANSTHGIDFASLVELGRMLQFAIAEQIVLFGIEVRDVSSFQEKCTLEVERAVPACAESVIQELERTTDSVLL